ncbi:hypothetical protein BJX68DRAFT_238403 [Aspergillus pseudodeflectus]|uniref:Uncharacterized protein n=1 Tax=Aspergillus pseudodeflectus TaxID=176178 RepID=A0ABR4KA16_9EURO
MGGKATGPSEPRGPGSSRETGVPSLNVLESLLESIYTKWHWLFSMRKTCWFKCLIYYVLALLVPTSYTITIREDPGDW